MTADELVVYTETNELKDVTMTVRNASHVEARVRSSGTGFALKRGLVEISPTQHATEYGHAQSILNRIPE
jgi:hypothetical protein